MVRSAWVAVGVVLVGHLAAAQLAQQGSKLVGSGAAGAAGQGNSVAISADGNTAIVGGPSDNGMNGAAWVFTRSGGVWSQQGAKLVGTGAVGAARQGFSVAISADGNTALVGGPGDFGGPWDYGENGAAWVFTRSGGVWSQQGGKLLGSDPAGTYTGGTDQGWSVALSADGNTAVVGGPDMDNVGQGAAWVFGRLGAVWSQEGLLRGPPSGANDVGLSVAISASGDTVIVGGYRDNTDFTGAGLVFTRSGGVWSQQGGKLVGTGAVGAAWQGSAVALSADGNTAILGGSADDSNAGAMWLFTRSGGVWSQQGDKLVGTGAVGSAGQGGSVALSTDGNTVLVGGSGDSSGIGAAWVFQRSGGIWAQQGNKLVGTGSAGAAKQGGAVALSADGSTAIVGGFGENSGVGAAWVFSAPVYTMWVPVATHAQGLAGSDWRSDLDLLNAGAASANVRLTFRGGVGTNTTYVPPGAQSILTDIVGQLGATGSGAIEVTSDQPLRITERTYNIISSGADCYANGTQGQSYPALSPSSGLAAGQSAYLPGLVENAAYRTDIGVMTTDPGGATVLVELFDGAGTKLTQYTVTLAQGQWAQGSRPFAKKAGQTALDRGYARITVQSGSGANAFASVIDNVTNSPTTVTVQP